MACGCPRRTQRSSRQTSAPDHRDGGRRVLPPRSSRRTSTPNRGDRGRPRARAWRSPPRPCAARALPRAAPRRRPRRRALPRSSRPSFRRPDGICGPALRWHFPRRVGHPSSSAHPPPQASSRRRDELETAPVVVKAAEVIQIPIQAELTSTFSLTRTVRRRSVARNLSPSHTAHSLPTRSGRAAHLPTPPRLAAPPPWLPRPAQQDFDCRSGHLAFHNSTTESGQ